MVYCRIPQAGRVGVMVPSESRASAVSPTRLRTRSLDPSLGAKAVAEEKHRATKAAENLIMPIFRSGPSTIPSFLEVVWKDLGPAATPQSLSSWAAQGVVISMLTSYVSRRSAAKVTSGGTHSHEIPQRVSCHRPPSQVMVLKRRGVRNESVVTGLAVSSFEKSFL